ncbi:MULTISPECIES: coenzyme F420-0:L-glutamate ligase [unclassified Ornithinimicrobium]|uniref:coenzyme F420-0:L-glutamate ligase n=1 Tax=unclassified Ornithinimicrobium TaxID=2615080 RepID=UPI0038526CF3
MSDADPGVLQLIPLTGVPEVREGADLAALLTAALVPHGGLADGDVLVVSSKVVSKALGLREAPGAADPGTTGDREDAVLRHSVRVVAERRTPRGTTRIVEAVAGPVMAAAGIDASNTGPDGGILLLPPDPDLAALHLHTALTALLPHRPRFGVLLSDTAGRPWRDGQTDLALGAHGVRVLDDLRGGTDADGRHLAVTARAVGDELAAAADLVKGKQDAVPAALVRGRADLVLEGGPGARALVRTGPGDWFALGHREAVRAALGAAPATAAAVDVGVPSVVPEDASERGRRAVRLALLGHPGAEVAGSPTRGYAVSAADPVLAGRVAARLEVALHGEDLVADVAVDRPSAVDRPTARG